MMGLTMAWDGDGDGWGECSVVGLTCSVGEEGITSVVDVEVDVWHLSRLTTSVPARQTDVPIGYGVG